MFTLVETLFMELFFLVKVSNFHQLIYVSWLCNLPDSFTEKKTNSNSKIDNKKIRVIVCLRGKLPPNLKSNPNKTQIDAIFTWQKKTFCKLEFP